MSEKDKALPLQQSTYRGYTIGLLSYEDGLSCDLEFRRHFGASSYILLRVRAADGPTSTWSLLPSKIGANAVAPSGLLYEVVAARKKDIQPGLDAITTQLKGHAFGCFSLEYMEYPLASFSWYGASMAGFALGSVVRDGPPKTQARLDKLRADSVEFGDSLLHERKRSRIEQAELG